MSKGLYSLTFFLGAAVGSVITWYYLKDKYEQITQEEIDSVKEVFAKREAEKSREEKPEEKTEKKPIKQSKPNIMEYAAKLSEEGYINYSNTPEEVKENKVAPEDLPYVISPETFEEGDYDKVSYTYYSDGVLADETDEIVEIDGESVPADFDVRFGEYEDDVVYVRNDKYQVDIEICRDNSTYAEATGNKPPRVEIK